MCTFFIIRQSILFTWQNKYNLPWASWPAPKYNPRARVIYLKPSEVSNRFKVQSTLARLMESWWGKQLDQWPVSCCVRHSAELCYLVLLIYFFEYIQGACWWCYLQDPGNYSDLDLWDRVAELCQLLQCAELYRGGHSKVVDALE